MYCTHYKNLLKGTDEDPNLYSEHYQIEMDNDEAAEETQVEDMDESTDELINPLASLVSAELHEEEDVEVSWGRGLLNCIKRPGETSQTSRFNLN